MSKAKTPHRLKILRALENYDSARTPHRYRLRRALGQAISLSILFAVPLSGLARVDLWQGNHALLFRSVPFKHGLAGVIVGIGAMYVVTFLVNVIGGRLFCGWGCPVGQISRFGDAESLPGRKGLALWKARLEGGLFGTALVLSIFAWWVDLRVFWQGEGQVLALVWSLLASSVFLTWAHGRFWRWNFCMSVCPIGLYYSFVSPARWFGVHFRNQEETCIECDACDNVCPVHLKPRDLMAPSGERPGISIADAPGRNHCLECGDCVVACEWMIDLRGKDPVPLEIGFFKGPQRIAEAVQDAEESPDAA